MTKYIFNNEGKFLYKSEDKINNNQTIKNYALASIGLANDTYKYAIGYIDDKYYLNLLLYSYNITENNNTLLNITKDYQYFYEDPDNDKNSGYKNFMNQALSCEYMRYYTIYPYYFDILTCFFYYKNRIGTTYYNIDNNKFLYSWAKRSVYSSEHGDDYGLTFIKSEINYNRSLAFIWFHISEHNRIYFTTFNLTSNKMENKTYWIYDCSSEIYKTKINKITKNKEITFANEKIDKKTRAEIYNYTDYYKYNRSFLDFILNLERNQRNKEIITYVIIAVIVIILLAITIFLLIKYFKKSKEQKFENKWKESQKNEKVMNNILEELIPNNS